MECKFKTQDGQVLTAKDLSNIIANNGDVTDQEILLYELEKAATEGVAIEQGKVISRLNEIRKEFIHKEDQSDEIFVKEVLNDKSVSDRAMIVVKQGSNAPFDEKAWSTKIKNILFEQIKTKNPDLNEDGIKNIVEKSFEERKQFNDNSKGIGTDIHLIAQIIFSKNINDFDTANKTIHSLITDGEINFKTDFFKTNTVIRDEAIEYLLNFKNHLETTYEGCKFLTEFGLESKGLNTKGTYDTITSDYLAGAIDLIMVDAKGKVYLFDFKTSTTDSYRDWSQFKQDHTSAQLHIYSQMLRKEGIFVEKTKCVTIPLKIDKDTYDATLGKYSYKLTGISKFKTNRIVDFESRHAKKINIWFPNLPTAAKPEEWLKTEEVMNQVFITKEEDSTTDDTDVNYYFTKDAKGNYIPDRKKLVEYNFYEYPKGHRYANTYYCCFKNPSSSLEIQCKSIDDFRTRLKDVLIEVSNNKFEKAAKLARAFAEEYKNANGDPEKINYSNILGSNEAQQYWLKREISHYLENGNFELHTEDVYLDQGYLLWKHKTLGFVECVLISIDNLMKVKHLSKGTTILGKIMDDGHVDQREVMSATVGNIATMQFMNFLATSPGTRAWCSTSKDEEGNEQPCKIASIRVINPRGITKEIRPNLSFIVSNYNLLCDNSLNLLKKKDGLKRVDLSLFYNDPQSLALQAVSQCEDLKVVYDDFNTDNFSFDYEKVDNVLDFIDDCLKKLIDNKTKVKYQDLENFDPSDPNWRAIFYLINIQNALHGHTYISEMGQGKWFKDGTPTGLMIAAPGMSSSTTMRTFDEINKAYVDRVIQAVNKYGKDGKLACEEMYAHHNMDKLLGGYGNSEFYYNLFETEGNALSRDFILKDPYSDELDDTMREVIRQFMILNHRLTLLAQGSKKGLEDFSEEYINNICKQREWRKVPLMDAAFSRQLYNHHKASENWLETVKFACVNKWKELGNLYNDIMIEDVELFHKKIKDNLKKTFTIDRRCTWNSFNYVKHPEKRYNLLTQFGPERFETNIEIVMDNMLVAYFKEFYSKQYATQLSALKLELTYANRAGHDLTDVIDTFEMAVRTKFYGESPIPENLRKYFAPLARLKSIFSMLQIGGKMVSMLKEVVYGTFIGFSNAVGQGLPGVDAETYWKAFWYVCGESFKSMKGVSKLNHLQMEYHIANYGLSQVVNQRRLNSLGWRNWSTDTLFLTATSPDFFHRTIVLVAKMMADGTWDSYDFKEGSIGDGELTYDVMKDERFAKFTARNPDYNDPEYWQQKTLFEKYVDEFNKTGFTDKNGNKLSVTRDDDGNYYLPRPYLQREVDTFKNYADMLYGHYDDESKALINDTFLGAFWLQYKTFITAKVERYTMPPGVYNTHLLKQQYVTNENGEQEALYLKTTIEDGEIRRYVIPESDLTQRDIELRRLGTKGDPETGESVTAYIKWEGIPMEGIMQSMGSLSRTLMRVIKGDSEAWSELKLIWEDPTKRGNFIVALNDLIFMGLLGMVGSTLFGMYNDMDFSEAWNNETAVRQLVRAGNWAQNGLYDVFVGAMQDGPITNTISSMFQAPPIMTSIERAWKDSVDLLKGDSSAFEFLTNEVGALRIFDGMAQAANAA